ncbi:MAG TPA: polyprenyl synthetase family protein [Acidobacteriota bacterium]|nr:polyprenyl synthetase family protein [Acidobacteriota bacterium]
MPIAGKLREFEEHFNRSLGGHAGLIGEMAAHILDAPGKRIRPAMYLLSSGACPGGRDIEATPVYAAVAIELIHTATLLHDDVNDGARERRGRPAAGQLWGNLAAVLMGDHLFAKAFRILVDGGDQRVLETVSEASERVAVGELLQVQETRNFEVTEQDYLRIIGNKTASLFSAACEAGALTNGNDAERERFRDFGEFVGLGFQIADDLLDYLGDVAQTGKPSGTDLKSGNITLPLIYALQNAGDDGRHRVMEAVAQPAVNGFGEVVEFVRVNGGFDYARRRAAEYRKKALDLLSGLSESSYRLALEEVVNHSVDRQA